MSKIEQKTKELLQKAKVSKPAIPVDDIAMLLDIDVRYAALVGNISGLFYTENGKSIIGGNSLHSPVRQRFTVAHEIGHYYLKHKGDFFVDRRILFRSENSKDINPKEEIEANAFAASLLMPEEMVMNEIMKNELWDSDADTVVHKLATIFEVSTQAMEIRLQNLGLIYA